MFWAVCLPLTRLQANIRDSIFHSSDMKWTVTPINDFICLLDHRSSVKLMDLIPSNFLQTLLFKLSYFFFTNTVYDLVLDILNQVCGVDF